MNMNYSKISHYKNFKCGNFLITYAINSQVDMEKNISAE